ncbi:MAG: hypothetical protein ACYC6L_13845 [Anaerolineae bacterium]
MSFDRSEVPFLPNVQPQLARLAQRVEYRRLLTTAAALAVAALAGWLYLRQASTVAAYWHQIGQLEARKTDLRQQIANLQTEAAKAVSLAQLETIAKTMGFRRPVPGSTGERLELTIEAPVSVETAAVATAPAAPGTERNLVRRIWQRFQAWLRAEPGT